MKESDRSNQGREISPSNIARRGGYFFSRKCPLGPPDYPIKKDIEHSMSVTGELADERGHVSTPIAIGLAIGGGIVGAGIVTLVDRVFAAENEVSIDSVPGGTSFDGDRLVTNNSNSQSQSVEAEAKKIDPKEVFDPTATTGVISEINTIEMTLEEYQQIAPPVIDREDREENPVEFDKPGGRRQLTLERGTKVNTLIYIKTPEESIRTVHYTKDQDPGGLTGQDHIVFPNCRVWLGEKNEIKANDIFSAPITGEAYYSGSKLNYYKGKEIEEGSVIGGIFVIEGEYVDEKGKKFRANVTIHTLDAITKSLVENMSNSDDFIKIVKNQLPSGEEEVGNQMPLPEETPKVWVDQGNNLFKFVTEPPLQPFTPDQQTKSQIMVSVSYQGDIDENGIGNTFGGENCVHPTIDNKAVVIK